VPPRIAAEATVLIGAFEAGVLKRKLIQFCANETKAPPSLTGLSSKIGIRMASECISKRPDPRTHLVLLRVQPWTAQAYITAIAAEWVFTARYTDCQ